jgi:hypothetical protein
MSSDDLSAAADLSPNYDVLWSCLFQNLIKYLLGGRMPVETWEDKTMAVIESKGHVLGRVGSIEDVQDGRKLVEIIFVNELQLYAPPVVGRFTNHWTLRPPLRSLESGDIVCLLEGASHPTIIRPCHDHFAVIMIAVPLSKGNAENRGNCRWPELWRSITDFSHDFLLVWNWDKPPKSYRNKVFKNLIEPITRVSRPDKSSRLHNVKMIVHESKLDQKRAVALDKKATRYAELHGEEDVGTLQLEDRLATIYKKQGLLPLAGDLFWKVLQKRTQVQGRHHQDTLSTLANLVSIYVARWRNDMSQEMWNELTELLKQEDGTPVPEEKVVQIARLCHKEVMILLLHQRGKDVQITKGIVQAAAENERGEEMMLVLPDHNHDVGMTEQMVLAAVEDPNGAELLNRLHNQKVNFPITERVVQAIVKSGTKGEIIMGSLLSRRGSEIKLTEKLVQSVLEDGYYGQKVVRNICFHKADAEITEGIVVAVMQMSEGYRIMWSWIQSRKDDIPITEKVVEAMAKMLPGQLEELLAGREEDIPITERVIEAIASIESGDKIMKVLIDRKGQDIQITEGVLQAVLANKDRRAQLVELIMERRDDIQITEEMVQALTTRLEEAEDDDDEGEEEEEGEGEGELTVEDDVPDPATDLVKYVDDDDDDDDDDEEEEEDDDEEEEEDDDDDDEDDDDDDDEDDDDDDDGNDDDDDNDDGEDKEEEEEEAEDYDLADLYNEENTEKEVEKEDSEDLAVDAAKVKESKEENIKEEEAKEEAKEQEAKEEKAKEEEVKEEEVKEEEAKEEETKEEKIKKEKIKEENRLDHDLVPYCPPFLRLS